MRDMRTALLLLAAVLAGCAAQFPYYDPAVPHRAQPQGFRNTDPDFRRPSFSDFWTWQWNRLRDGLPRKPEGGWPFPVAPTTVSSAPEPSVTWVGHATVLLKVGGLAVITDPVFSERASPLGFTGPRRVVPATPSLEQLPHIDAVLISHNHYDHLDLESVKRLAAQAGGSPRFYVPLGLKAWFDDQCITEVEELDWWDKRALKGLEITLTPVQHWSRRTLTDENQSLWGGWAVRHPALSFFFSGDTGYSSDFAEIGKRFGAFDLAALPIGAYEPRWFMHAQHVDPAQAVKMHRDLHAKRSFGVHWGTFEGLTDEDMDEPPKKLATEAAAAALKPDEFFVLRHGETRSLSNR